MKMSKTKTCDIDKVNLNLYFEIKPSKEIEKNHENEDLNTLNRSVWSKTTKVTFFTSLVFTVFLILRHRMILKRTYEEQKMSMFSETAFYYSFYEDLINSSDNTFKLILNKLIYDDRSEYPDTINSISRFNIYQEIFLGIFYKITTNAIFFVKFLYLILNSIIFKKPILSSIYVDYLNPTFQDRIMLLSPFNFYYYTVNAILGIGMGILCGTSTLLANGSYFSGLTCMGFLFGNFQARLLSRISSLPLRENFALPFIWMNIIILIHILKEKDNFCLKKSWFYLYLSSLISLEFWQFSVFVITTQLISMYIIYLLGYKYLSFESKLMKLTTIHLFATLTSYFLHFGNYYILLTPLPQVGVSIIITVLINRTLNRLESNIEYSVSRSFFLGMISLVNFVIVRYIVHPISNHDTHVFDMLKSVFFGKNYSNFDTMIYKMGGSEFSWITYQQLMMIKNSNVLYFFLPNLFIILFSIIVDFITVASSSLQKKSSLDSNKIKYNQIPNRDIYIGDKNSIYSSSSNSSIDSSSTSSPKSTDTSLYDWKTCFEYNNERDNFSSVSKQERCKNNEDNLINKYNSIERELDTKYQDISIVYVGFQTIIFCILAIIVSRLRVLAIPYISITASLLASKSYLKFLMDYYINVFSRLFRKRPSNNNSIKLKCKDGNLNFKHIIFDLFYFIISVLIFSSSILKFPIGEMKSGLIPENNATSSKSRLVDWMNFNLPQGTPILADMVISATLRLMTNTKIITHPQYEHIKIRKRTQFIYSISACISIKELYEVMESLYNTDYLLLSIYRCALPNNDKNAITIIQVTEYLDNLRHRCNNQEHLFQRTCWRLQLDDHSRYFDLVYRNAHYSIYKRKKREELESIEKNYYEKYDFLNNYSQFPFRRKLLDWNETWKPWIINHCIVNDHYCPQNIVDYARTIIDIYNLIDVSALIYEKAISIYPDNAYVIYNYAEFLDYDFGGESKQVLEYYDKSLKLLKREPLYKYKQDSVSLSGFMQGNLNRNNLNLGFVLKMIMNFILYKDQTIGRTEENITSSIKLLFENEFIKEFASNLNQLDKNQVIDYLHHHNIVDINYDMCLSNFAYNLCMIASYLRTLERENLKLLSLQNKYPIWLIQTIYKKLWIISNLIDPNNACLIKYWILFNEKEKMNIDYIYSFLLG